MTTAALIGGFLLLLISGCRCHSRWRRLAFYVMVVGVQPHLVV